MDEDRKTITTTSGEEKKVIRFIDFGMDREAIAVCEDGVYIKRGEIHYEKTSDEL